MDWAEVASRQPRLARLGARLLERPGVVLVVTVRRNGTPRLSPVEPLFWERDLWLSMLWNSHKARDLFRDPRILVHSIVTGRDGALGEYKVRGRAIVESDKEVQRSYAQVVSEQLGWAPEVGHFHLFKTDVADITFIRYDGETGDQFVTRWPEGTEYVRRGITPTSLGPAEAHSELLV
jgi:hypothetical protein